MPQTQINEIEGMMQQVAKNMKTIRQCETKSITDCE
jgi:hypothetical protein